MVERCESDGELLSESVKGESDPDWVELDTLLGDDR
jgi:hypothetical protein